MTTPTATPIARQREFVEQIQNRGDLGAIPDFVHPDFTDHTAVPGLPAHGPEAVATILGAIREAFPDHDGQIVHMLASDDLVATYKMFTGTNTGPLFGAPPTGRRATIRVMDFVRYRDGLIVDHWNIVDMAGLTAQLAG